ncbi:glycosyltransferase [Ancylobacter amanitiformis]|uniref:Glycosyltransferase involved in cell wall biosynthesis n=1 Tax=Ancylobacter amanitiformis TaxID=217069 RepID=A0ABU0LUX2_9HYPH|nr:glycosyltransferase [Ancylobacter amanitiformis]MDQ0512524.1 glycosyltransferase involved in cell wall biosynthesis [Ancylobacter amanitiformis]
MNLEAFGRQTGRDFGQTSFASLAENLRERHASGDDSRPEDQLQSAWKLADSRHNYLRIANDEHIVGGVFVEGGQCIAWGFNRADLLKPVTLRLVVDGATVFERTTSPEALMPIHPTGYLLAGHRQIRLTIDGAGAAAPAFDAQDYWADAETREDLANFIIGIADSARAGRLHHLVWHEIPNVTRRLETSDEPPARWRASTYTRYMADRLGLQGKLSGGQSVANWIVSDVFEDWYKRQVFCLTDEIHALLSEPVMNRRVMKHEISLTLFAFWRRHYPHVDIFTDDGLRLVQYKFATAPYISDKNNVKLVSEGLRRSLSAPADMYRNRELPWSWYWLFLLEDQGLGSRMREEGFVRLTSFKEVALDVTQPDRLSFAPHIWRAYWGAGGTSAFTRFDLALISIIADTPTPELAIAERGADFWSERLRSDVYARTPQLSVLSATGRIEATPAVIEDEVPRRDLVIIGYANTTGVGRNLAMFTEALSGFNPLVFNADDGACLNPETGYDPAIGVRARVVLLCINADRAPEMIARFAGICEDAHIIGFYLWESDRPPANHTLGALTVDEIWAPSNYVADAYAKITSVPVKVVDKGLHAPLAYTPFLDRFRQDPSEFIFLTAAEFGSSIVRKNPLDVVKAFQRAFDGSDLNVRLVIKIREVTPGHWSNIDSYWEEIEERIAGDDRISILEGNLTPEEYWTLLWTVDAMVSLHRSEGFGYVIADAMFADKAVIVSDYSGSQDFCDEQTAFLVPVQQTPAPPESLASRGYIGQWGIPDVEAAARAMYQAAEDGDLRAMRARAGQERVLRKYDFTNWTQAISVEIAERIERSRRKLEETANTIAPSAPVATSQS